MDLPLDKLNKCYLKSLLYRPQYQTQQYKPIPHPSGIPGTPPSALTHPTGQNSVNQAAEALHSFKRQARRSVAEYPKLQDDKHWTEWRRSFHAIATIQGVAEVLDPTYVPEDDMVAVWFEMQKFLYSVMVVSVRTTFGKGIVRKHEEEQDAQAV